MRMLLFYERVFRTHTLHSIDVLHKKDPSCG